MYIRIAILTILAACLTPLAAHHGTADDSMTTAQAQYLPFLAAQDPFEPLFGPRRRKAGLDQTARELGERAKVGPAGGENVREGHGWIVGACPGAVEGGDWLHFRP